MPLTVTQRNFIDQSFVGLRAALAIQFQITDYSHNKIGTEYIATTKIVEELLRFNPGLVDIELKTRLILNRISVGGGFGKAVYSGIRSGRIDAVVFKDASKLLPAYLAEVKINVGSLGSIRKDLDRFAGVINRLATPHTLETFGAAVFPYTATGSTIKLINRRAARFVKKIKKQLKSFAKTYPRLVFRLHLDKGHIVKPELEMIDLDDGSSVCVGLLPGYRTIGLAVSVSRI